MTRAAKWATLAACIAVAGAASIGVRQDANWDLKNYHYYNAYAFLNGRIAWDVAPAQLQSYHNPLLDLPFYWMATTWPSARAVAFAMGAWTGVAAFFVLRSTLALLAPYARVDRLLGAGVALAAGFTGAAGMAVLGSTMNEWPCTALVLAALYVLLAPVATGAEPASRRLWLAGLLLGIATGLKLTYGVYAMAAGVAVASFGPAQARVRRTALLGACAFAGFLLAYAFWGAILWRELDNPFFPYFNGVFKSPWWQPVSWMDPNFGPRDAWQAITFPFLLANHSRLTSEVGFRDYRMATLFVLALLCGAKLAWMRLRTPSRAIAGDDAGARAADIRDPTASGWRLVVVFAVAGYVLWLKLFGIYRYLQPVEALSGLLVAGAVAYLVPAGAPRRIAIVVLGIALVASTHKMDWGRIDFGRAYFEIGAPALEPGALVIVGEGEPMAYAIPFLRPDARFVNPSSNLLDPGQDNRLARKVRTLVATHAGPFYTLDFRTAKTTDSLLARFGLVRDAAACEVFHSRFDTDAMQVCRVHRKAP